MDSIEGQMMNNTCEFQANLEYFRDFLQKRGSAENTIDSYLTSVRHYHSLYQDVTVEYLQAYKVWPVSYTHLDVYKRQGLHYGRFPFPYCPRR